MKKIFFKSRDGLKLCGVWHIPQKHTNKAIVLAHGITVDKDEDGIFVDLAETLKNHGFTVFRFDFRGHGESESESHEMTIQGEIADLTAAVNLVKQDGLKKIGLLGASFGGGVASLYTSIHQNELKCLCLWNPALNYDHCFLNPITPWMVKQIKRIRLEFKMKGWAQLGSRKFKIGKQLFEEMEHFYPYKSLKEINLPILIINGDKDDKVSYLDSQEYAYDCPKGDFILIKDAEHGFHQSWEETLVLKETLNFFQKYQ